MRCSNFSALKSALVSGAAVSALPCTIGDGDPELVRCFPPRDEWDIPIFLVARRAILRRPPARDLFDSIAAYFTEHPALLTGRARLMRPEILNPLFAEAEVLKGVGPQVAKLLKRLDLTRVVDVLFHLPTGSIERMRVPAASAAVLGRNIIVDLTPFEVRESRSGRGPMRVFASDGDGNTISLIYFNNPGLGEAQRANRPAADHFRQARSLWRRMADHPSRGDRTGQGTGSRRCASRSIR